MDHVNIDSGTSVLTFLREIRSTGSSSSPVRSLIINARSYTLKPQLSPDSKTRNDIIGIASKKRPRAPPAIADNPASQLTEQHLVSLLQIVQRSLLELHLERVPFNSLRRRNLSQVTTLLLGTNLQTLTLRGRPDSVDHHFHFHTLGALLVCLPRLKTLSLEYIRVMIRLTSTESRTRPTFELVTISIHNCPTFERDQYYWLFASTMRADSLRSLDLDYHHPRADRLRRVAWLGWPVRRLRLSTTELGVTEGFAFNFPSLDSLELDTQVGVNFVELLSNLKKTLVRFVDCSEGEENGVDLRVLALAIEVGWSTTRLESISVRRKKGWERLAKACESRRIDLHKISRAQHAKMTQALS